MNDITNHLPLCSHLSVLPLWIKLTPLADINKPTLQLTIVSLLTTAVMAWVKLNTKTMLWTESTHCLWTILMICSNKILLTKKTLLNYIVFNHLFTLPYMYCNRAWKKCFFFHLFFEISQKRLKLFWLKNLGETMAFRSTKALISEHRKIMFFEIITVLSKYLLAS